MPTTSSSDSVSSDRARRRLVVPNALAGFAPLVVPFPAPIAEWRENSPLPRADIVVITWTADELDGLLRMLAPKLPPNTPTKGYPYTRNFHRVWPALATHRIAQWRERRSEATPALNIFRPESRQSGSFGDFVKVGIGSLNVLLFRSNLHLNTDGREQPLRTLIKQIIEECQPRLVLSVGTAGGVDPVDELGDVVVSNSAAFFMGEEFSDAEHNGLRYTSPWQPSDKFRATVETSENMPIILEEPLRGPSEAYAALMPEAGFAPKPAPDRTSCRMRIADKPILTTDFFEYGTTSNALHRYGSAVEMGDALVAMTCSESKIPFGFVRNVSDPVMNGEVDSDLLTYYATQIYYGVGTQTSMNGAAVIWALIAAEAENSQRLDSLLGQETVVDPITLPRRAEHLSPVRKPFEPIVWTNDEPRFVSGSYPTLPPAFSEVKEWDGRKRQYVVSRDYLDWAPLPTSPGLIVVLSRDDESWEALQHVFFGPLDAKENWKDEWTLYRRNFDRLRREQTLQRLIQMDHRESSIPSREIRAAGRYRIAQAGGRSVLFFDTRVSLLLDESVQALDEVVTQVLDETRPALVLSVDMGHATTKELAPGTVVLSPRARFYLTGDLGGYEHNGESFGSDYRPEQRFFAAAEQRMRASIWPELRPPTPALARAMGQPVRPSASTASIQLVDKAVVTAPRMVNLGFFQIPLYMTATAGAQIHSLGPVIETGAAVVARRCSERAISFSSVSGVAVPLLVHEHEEDRARYAQFFERAFQRQAAFNAALATWAVVAGEICK